MTSLLGRFSAREDVVRRRPEVDDDLGVALGQALAGAQVERHAGPAPVLHLGAQRDEGLGRAAWLAPCPPRESRAPACRRRCRRGTGRARRPCRRSRAANGLQRAQHLQLLVADRIGDVARRWLHRDHRQQLQRVVLDHVAQRAGAAVEIAARADAERLGQRDLDVGDALAPPERLEQRVAEAQRHQVLHRRLAEVVVDPKRLLLGEYRAHDAVDLLRARQVVAERLLEHDAHLAARSGRRRRAARRRREQVGAGRQEHHDDVGGACAATSMRASPSGA